MPQSPILFEAELDSQLELLIKIINRAINESTPKQRLCARSLPGFDEECKELQMRARRLKKAYNWNPSADTWEEYRVARAVKGRVIDKKKRNGYREYCQKACDSPRAMWQACKTARRPGPVQSYLRPIQRIDKTTTNNPEEKVEIFKNGFFHSLPTYKPLYIRQGLICLILQRRKSNWQF